MVLVNLVSQFSDLIITGKFSTSMVPSAQLNFGSKVANQGYPSIKSLCPKSVTRNLILFCFFLVCTLRST